MQIYLKISAVLCLAGFALSGGAEARERTRNYSYTPMWAKQRNIARDDTNAYLDSGDLVRRKTFVENFFDRQDAKVTAEIRQDYFLRQQKFERRQTSGLIRVEDERLHNEEMSGFSKDAMKRLSRTHVKVVEKRLKVAGEELRGVREPVALAALAAALYRGRTFRFNVAGTRWESSAGAKDRNASMALVLPGLKSTVGYDQADKLKGTLNADLSDIFPNVAAEVSTAQKGSVGLTYGVSF